MENYLVTWYVDIYKNVYGLNSDYTSIIQKFDVYLKRMINGVSFGTFSNIIMVIGITLLLFHFFSDMTERAADKQVSMLMTGKAFGLLFASLFVMFHTKEIFIFLLRFTEELNESLTVRNQGLENINKFLSSEIVLTLMYRCVSNHFGLWSIIGYTLIALPLMLVSLVTKLYVMYFAISRIVQLFVYYVFAPIGLSDIFESSPSGGVNLQSSGFRYLRIMLSIMMQLVVITVVLQVFPLINSSAKSGYYEDRGDVLAGEEGDVEETYGRSSVYPLVNFEYTDHSSPIREIITNSNNKILESLEVLYKLGDEEEEEKEALKESEIYKITKVVSLKGEIKNQDEADKILTEEKYRMTISSVTLFFNWCSGTDGSKLGLLILLMVIKALMIYTAPKLCNHITGVAI